MAENGGDSEIKIINPYNFNNKLINKHNVHKILSNYGISFDIKDISLYQNSFVHKSYCVKKEEETQEDVELAERPEGALPLQRFDLMKRLEYLGDSILNAIIAKYLYEEDFRIKRRFYDKIEN